MMGGEFSRGLMMAYQLILNKMSVSLYSFVQMLMFFSFAKQLSDARRPIIYIVQYASSIKIYIYSCSRFVIIWNVCAAATQITMSDYQNFHDFRVDPPIIAKVQQRLLQCLPVLLFSKLTSARILEACGFLIGGERDDPEIIGIRPKFTPTYLPKIHFIHV